MGDSSGKFKHKRGTKKHVCVNDSMPLSIVIGYGNEHGSKKLLELIGGLDWRHGQLYADAAYEMAKIIQKNNHKI
jgi:hypothetical protein